MTPVIWLSLHDEIDARGYWDQALLEDLLKDFDHTEYSGEAQLTLDFAIVVIPAQHHADDIDRINGIIGGLRSCLVILTGDELSLFPYEELSHPNMKLWVMTPRKGKHDKADRFLSNGYTPHTKKGLGINKPLDWFFAGQINHQRRERMARTLRQTLTEQDWEGELLETEGFTQGMPKEEYIEKLSSAKVVLCPSGPGTPDSFRLFEALESGCIPLADSRTPGASKDEQYWEYVFGEVPFPIVDDWRHIDGEISEALKGWPRNVIKIQAWWLREKLKIERDLDRHISYLSGEDREYQPITVLIPTSPIPSHPSTEIIEKTVASVRERLPKSRIVLMIDGVREEQKDRSEDYYEYVRRLLIKANEWGNCLPLIQEEHQHQANMTREALEYVDTPLVLFVEHDTPLVGEYDWDLILNLHGLDLLRFSHESNHLFDLYPDMMLDKKPINMGIPVVRTSQWSQRPHLATTEFYRRILADHFAHRPRTMIEDKIHGVVANAYKDRGVAGWQDYRLAVYAPEGDIKRSGNLDGREDDPKYEMEE